MVDEKSVRVIWRRKNAGESIATSSFFVLRFTLDKTQSRLYVLKSEDALEFVRKVC